MAGPAGSSQTFLDQALALFQNARDSVRRSVIPGLDILPDGEIIVENTAVNNTTSAGIQVQFPCDAYVVGIWGVTQDGLIASMAATKLEVKLDGNIDLFQNGTGGSAFCSFARLMGLYTGNPWRGLVRAARQNPWTAFIKTTANIVADIGFTYINVSQPRG